MRISKNSCFRHAPTKVFLATILSVVAIGIYSLYGAVDIRPSTQQSASSTSFVSTSDKYTQSQALMSLPDIKKLISQTYSTKAYDKIISDILAQEEKYKDYYVFYHGTDNVWRLPQDLYTKLYARFNPSLLDPSVKDFIFLRFGSHYPSIRPQEFLLRELKQNGLVNDHNFGELLFSANLALFGNVGTPSECAWEYFMKSRGHTNPSRSIYQQIMNIFGLTQKYIDELLSLVSIYQTKEQTLLQVFVPKNLVDDIGYVAWIRGIPAHEETMDWVLASVRSKQFPKTQQSLDSLTNVFKNEQEKNPLFKNMLRQVQADGFKLSTFLQTYRNNPASIKNINSYMARLIFTSAVLLNPQSGVKIFRYSTVTPKNLNLYHQRLDQVINKIVAEK